VLEQIAGMTIKIKQYDSRICRALTDTISNRRKVAWGSGDE
jgi:hypothetical protein